MARPCRHRAIYEASLAMDASEHTPFRRAETTSMKTSFARPSRRENERVLIFVHSCRAHKDIFMREAMILGARLFE